eukprot:5971823-Prymnesium_polylepis.1
MHCAVCSVRVSQRLACVDFKTQEVLCPLHFQRRVLQQREAARAQPSTLPTGRTDAEEAVAPAADTAASHQTAIDLLASRADSAVTERAKPSEHQPDRREAAAEDTTEQAAAMCDAAHSTAASERSAAAPAGVKHKRPPVEQPIGEHDEVAALQAARR